VRRRPLKLADFAARTLGRRQAKPIPPIQSALAGLGLGLDKLPAPVGGPGGALDQVNGVVKTVASTVQGLPVVGGLTPVVGGLVNTVGGVVSPLVAGVPVVGPKLSSTVDGVTGLGAAVLGARSRRRQVSPMPFEIASMPVLPSVAADPIDTDMAMPTSTIASAISGLPTASVVSAAPEPIPTTLASLESDTDPVVAAEAACVCSLMASLTLQLPGQRPEPAALARAAARRCAPERRRRRTRRRFRRAVVHSSGADQCAGER